LQSKLTLGHGKCTTEEEVDKVLAKIKEMLPDGS